MQTPATGQHSHRSLPQILQELQMENTELHRGALEKLVFYFVQQFGLEFKAWRKRGDMLKKTEANAIAENTYPIFNRWHIYCKNMPDCRIFEDDVATEVGLSMQIYRFLQRRHKLLSIFLKRRRGEQ